MTRDHNPPSSDCLCFGRLSGRNSLFYGPNGLLAAKRAAKNVGELLLLIQQ